MDAAGVFEAQAAYRDVAGDLIVFGPAEIGPCLELYAGSAAGIEFEGVEVGVAEIGVELVDGVAGLPGEAEKTLEQEVEVGVGADETAVEGVAGIGTGGGNARVVVGEGVESVDEEGVEPQRRTAVGERGFKVGTHCHGAELLDVGDLAGVKVVGAD